MPFQKEGKLAEVGCGFGKFLKVFNKNFPDWYLHGFDLGDQYTDTINSIQNAKYYKNDFGISKEQYDLIIGIHLLEHVDDPLEFLNICKDRLAKNGLIFMQMPNITTSTFDLIIADHISHFSVKDITQLANSAGLNVEFISDEIISKELFCIFSNSPQKIQNKAGNRKKDSGQIDVNLNILRTFEKFCQLENESVYIFGSSIGGSWLSRYFGKNQISFIDEDPSRVGNKHLDIEIYSTSCLDEFKRVLLPFPEITARSIADRFSKTKAHFIHPKFSSIVKKNLE